MPCVSVLKHATDNDVAVGHTASWLPQIASVVFAYATPTQVGVATSWRCGYLFGYLQLFVLDVR